MYNPIFPASLKPGAHAQKKLLLWPHHSFGWPTGPSHAATAILEAALAEDPRWCCHLKFL